MGSTRLPGKVLLRVYDDFTILSLLVTRLRALADTLGPIVVATSQLSGDDAIAREAAALGCEVYRGSEDDVLSRFVDLVQARDARFVVRATADNPFMSGVVGEWLLARCAARDADYAFARNLPRGVSPEVARGAALVALAEVAPDAAEREHVTLGLKKRPGYRRLLLDYPLDAPIPPDVDLSVDTAEDLARVRRVAAIAVRAHGPHVTIAELVAAHRVAAA